MKTLKHLLAVLALVIWPSEVFAYVSCPKGTRKVKEYSQENYYLGIMPDPKTAPSSLAECIGTRNPEFGYMSLKCGDITLKKSEIREGINDFIDYGSVNVEAKSGGLVKFSPFTVEKMVTGNKGTQFEFEEMTNQLAYWCMRGFSGGPNGATMGEYGTIRGASLNSSLHMIHDFRNENKCTTIKQSGEKHFLQTSVATIWWSNLTDKLIFGHSLIKDGSICRKIEVF